jgi:antitoxin component YwqK of YwqJK toxin-antitoxin module
MINFSRVYSVGIMIIVSVFILFNCTNEVRFDELVERNGLVYERNSDELFSGKSEWYHDSGEKWWVIEYKNGKAHGNHTSWYENGKKSEQAEFNNDALDGDYKTWHENGKKELYVELDDGEFDGGYTSWYENGKKCFQIDEVTGGELKSGMESILFVGIFDANGWNQGKSPANLRDAKDIIIDGTYKHWYENGELHWKAEFDDGIIVGDIKEWSESGKRLK